MRNKGKCLEKIGFAPKFNYENIVMLLLAINLLSQYFLDGLLVFIPVTDSMRYISKIIDIGVYFVALIFAVQGEYTRKKIGILIAGYLLMLITCLTTGEIGLLGLWTWIILAGKVPYNKWIRVSLYCHCIGISVGIIATVTGIHQDATVYYRSLLSTRYTFGLDQPNFTGNVLFVIAASYCWLKKEKLKAKDYLILMFIIITMFVFMNSQGTTIVLLAFTFLIFLFQNVIQNKGLKRKGLFFIFYLSILCAVLSIILSVINVAEIPILVHLDKLMSCRYSLAYRTFKVYGFSLFGQNVDFTYGGSKYYMDCMWIYLPVHYGIVFSAFFVYLYFSAMYRFIKKGDTLTVIIFFCGALYAMEQRIWPFLFGWVFIIFLAEKLFRDNSYNDNFCNTNNKEEFLNEKKYI